MNTVPINDAIVKEIAINARAERDFEALTEPTQRVQWWGREGRFQATHAESELRVGGAWLVRGTTSGGGPFSVHGEYRTIERPGLLEFTWLPDWLENTPVTLVRFELTEANGTTTVRLTHSGFTTGLPSSSFQGWPTLLQKLQAHVEG